jgi:hypothetical protein
MRIYNAALRYDDIHGMVFDTCTCAERARGAWAWAWGTRTRVCRYSLYMYSVRICGINSILYVCVVCWCAVCILFV